MWASQLLTLHTTTRNCRTNITFDFRATPDFRRVEGVEVILVETVTPTISSCDSLVRVCLPARTTLPVLTLEFLLSPDSDWVHLAEMTFYNIDKTCLSPPTTMESSTTSKHNTPETYSSPSLIRPPVILFP